MSRNKNDKPALFVEKDVEKTVEEQAPIAEDEGAADEEIDEELDDETDEEIDDAEDDDEEETPCVILGRLSDLKGFGDPGLLRKHGDRPVWFMIQGDSDFMTLFDKHRERPIPPALSRSIMDVLRSFADTESDALQMVLGATDTIEFGFHEGASFDDVTEAFEDDGFDVAFVLQDGKVIDNVDEDD